MKVNLQLSSILNSNRDDIIIDNYDEKYFPPRPKGELSHSQMFEYWSKRLKEQGYDYTPDHFDMTKNIGVIFGITELK